MTTQYSFHLWSAISLVALLILAAAIGRGAKIGSFGILIDSRGRYSLTHFQVVVWTILILSTFLGVLIAKGFDPSVVIPTQLLGLMGISAGSAVAATGAKSGKDASGANVARVGRFTLSDNTTRDIVAHPAQIWLEEEGDLADKVISVTKFQNFIFTIAAVALYVGLALKANGLPELPESAVWLIGISHAGYVGGKMPSKK